MKEHVREHPQILAAAERQMQTWVMGQEAEARTVRAKDYRHLAREMHPYIAVSRQTGAGGGEIAGLVGKKLGWEVLDKGLVDRVADRFHVSRVMLELVDETQSSWVYDVLGTWMDRNVIPHEKYVAYLGRVVLAAVRHKNHILVGRGAQFLLPRDKGLAVRVIASEKYCIDQIMQREGLSTAEARRTVERTDLGRREFVRRYFHHDIDDPHVYDLVINVERLGVAGTAEQILAAAGQTSIV